MGCSLQQWAYAETIHVNSVLHYLLLISQLARWSIDQVHFPGLSSCLLLATDFSPSLLIHKKNGCQVTCHRLCLPAMGGWHGCLATATDSLLLDLPSVSSVDDLRITVLRQQWVIAPCSPSPCHLWFIDKQLKVSKNNYQEGKHPQFSEQPIFLRPRVLLKPRTFFFFFFFGLWTRAKMMLARTERTGGALCSLAGSS